MRRAVIKLLEKNGWKRNGNLFNRVVNGRIEQINLSQNRLIMTMLMGNLPVDIVKTNYDKLAIESGFLVAKIDGKTKYICKLVS